MSDSLTCDNCQTTLGATDNELYNWFTVHLGAGRETGTRHDFCSAACATEGIETLRQKTVNEAMEAMDDILADEDA